MGKRFDVFRNVSRRFMRDRIRSMSKDQWLRISPRTGKPVRPGNYKAGPGRGHSGVPARASRLAATEPISTPAPIPERPPITSDVTAEDAHTLLQRIYNDTSLPLYARLDAARIAIRHETPPIAASKPLGGPDTDLARKLEEGRKRAAELNQRVLEERQRRIDQDAQAIGENDQ
jgi:hypothetical protein